MNALFSWTHARKDGNSANESRMHCIAARRRMEQYPEPENVEEEAGDREVTMWVSSRTRHMSTADTSKEDFGGLLGDDGGGDDDDGGSKDGDRQQTDASSCSHSENNVGAKSTKVV